jgi:hypothetical protein
MYNFSVAIFLPLLITYILYPSMFSTKIINSQKSYLLHVGQRRWGAIPNPQSCWTIVVLLADAVHIFRVFSSRGSLRNGNSRNAKTGHDLVLRPLCYVVLHERQPHAFIGPASELVSTGCVCRQRVLRRSQLTLSRFEAGNGEHALALLRVRVGLHSRHHFHLQNKPKLPFMWRYELLRCGFCFTCV